MGIDPDLLPRLFNAFEQGDELTAKKAGGLGLGLAISRALVVAHGGNLAAASEGKGKGATFTVELPVAEPVPASVPAPTAPAAAVRRALNVLLVEDDVFTQRAMAKLLTQMGHKLSAADGVRSALNLAARERFDLVISDLGLPDGNGHDLMRAIRQRRGDIRAIALSGYGMEEDLRRSREAGFAEHLTKPITPEKLEAVIARVTSASGPPSG
jgi:two-component system CheB/CheR fusion protein